MYINKKMYKYNIKYIIVKKTYNVPPFPPIGIIYLSALVTMAPLTDW